jgi:phosphatidate cytidylyltransferase
MILTIYITILSYFLLGAIGFYFINRKKDRKTAHQNIVKFITYFFIIHIIFASIEPTPKSMYCVVNHEKQKFKTLKFC